MTDARVDPVVEETLLRLGLTGEHADRVRRQLGASPPAAEGATDHAARLDSLLQESAAPAPPTQSPQDYRSPLTADFAPPPEPGFDRRAALAELRRESARVRAGLNEIDAPQTAANEPAAVRRARRAAARGEQPAAAASEAPEDFEMSPDGANSYLPTPTMQQFHACDDLVRCILGPVGSGKSSACALEIFFRALASPPIGRERIRHSRWLVARATYSELKSTTIKTFLYWLGRYGTITYGSPITYTMRQLLPDGTTVLLEVEFLPLDGPDAVARLRSLELTGAWLNEASLLSDNHITEIIGRLRFRSGDYARDRQPWRGIILDSNMPTMRHWIYDVFEIKPPSGFKLFKQPAALIQQLDGTYVPNPQAENVDKLPGGFEYYFRMVNSTDEKMRQKIRVLVLAEYGAVFDGRPVYESSWRQRVHIAKSGVQPRRGQLLVIGVDFGLSPAACFMQQGQFGELLVLDECTARDSPFDDFIMSQLKPKIAERFNGMSVLCVGDPAGVNRSALAKYTGFQMLHLAGLAAVPAFTNAFQIRRDAVSYFLRRNEGFFIDPRCQMLIDGFEGGYRYHKRNDTEVDNTEYTHPHDALQYGACYFYRPQAFAPRPSTRGGVTVQQAAIDTGAITSPPTMKPNFYV